MSCVETQTALQLLFSLSVWLHEAGAAGTSVELDDGSSSAVCLHEASAASSQLPMLSKIRRRNSLVLRNSYNLLAPQEELPDCNAPAPPRILSCTPPSCTPSPKPNGDASCFLPQIKCGRGAKEQSRSEKRSWAAGNKRSRPGPSLQQHPLISLSDVSRKIK